MEFGYAIKDIDEEEYYSDLPNTPFVQWLALAQIFSSKWSAELIVIKSTYTRWHEGYRVPRNLKIVKVELKEVE